MADEQDHTAQFPQWGFVPSRLQWAAQCYTHDPVFAARAYRMAQACPSDPQEAMLCLELACCWASEDPAIRNGVPYIPAVPMQEAVLPFDVLDHWLDWQRHLGRKVGTLMEKDGFVVIGYPLPVPMTYVGYDAIPSPVLVTARDGMIQVPEKHPFALMLPSLGFEPIASQTAAVMSTLACAKLPRELPEGLHLQRVETAEHVEDYQQVTHLAYEASYGASGAHQFFRRRTLLGHRNVQAWIVYEGETPLRVITGFVANGIVGAHAGAAVPAIRGRHLSEPLLAHVAAWGHALGANTVAGIAMPQAVPILSRIGATTVDTYTTYRRSR